MQRICLLSWLFWNTRLSSWKTRTRSFENHSRDCWSLHFHSNICPDDLDYGWPIPYLETNLPHNQETTCWQYKFRQSIIHTISGYWNIWHGMHHCHDCFIFCNRKSIGIAFALRAFAFAKADLAWQNFVLGVARWPKLSRLGCQIAAPAPVSLRSTARLALRAFAFAKADLAT